MVGQTVSHYRIVEQLGAGGMGVVYKADDLRLKRAVALKFLPLELTRDPEAKQRLIQEAQAASALDHPNICVIHEIDETPDGRVFIAMGYYEGDTLKARIARGPLPVADAVDIAMQVARALAGAHEAGIVHRDVKPANIMVTHRGEVKLVDFGIAKLTGQTRVTRTGTTLGTVAYMAPEQIAGRDADERSDIWALGVVLFEMLTGRLPFRGDHEIALINAIVNDQPRSVRELRTEVPPSLDRVVARALEKDPAARDASAREFLQHLTEMQPRLTGTVPLAAAPPRWRTLARPRVAVPVMLVLLAVAATGALSIARASNARRVKVTAVADIRRLVAEDDYVGAMAVANEASRVVGGDPALSSLWPAMSVVRSLQSTPPGARVLVRDAQLRHDWHLLGETPIPHARVPLGVSRWKFEKAGYDTAEFVESSGGPQAFQRLRTGVELTPSGSVPPGMVRVPPSRLALTLLGYNYNLTIPSAEYLIDDHEVTNKEFKEFLDGGGYNKREYWTEPIVKDDRTLAWQDAMALFHDQTGRPGPSTWEVGTYPQGQDDFPVAGVSWYEAAAYAAFKGKRLPTIYHFVNAAGPGFAAQIAPLSNVAGKGPVAVKRSRAISPFGLYDVAGNVKEWCSNEMPPGRRYILGGSWNEPDYMFLYADARSPLDRSAQHGFRCVRYPTPASLPEATTRAVERRVRDYATEKPVSDEVFGVYESLFAYDPAPLDAKVESVDDSAAGWRHERVSFSAAYGGQRLIAHLYLPKQVKAPYQTILYWPGSSALRPGSSDAIDTSAFDYLLLSGRAVLTPVYFGTLDRFDGRGSSWPDTTRAYRDWVTKQVNDARRALDYAETRPDSKRDGLGYMGFSWGGRMGSIVLALDPRLGAAVFMAGGLSAADAPPEVDPLNFAPRVSTPVLMVNGDSDYIFELAASQKPLFRLLGSPADRKRHLVLPGGHGIIGDKRSQVIREILDWFDRYLGRP
ncbi:MAG: protein kinase [Acidobacteria bacterium]|nr:protein kinase [Acidobacteriota bacterium]MCA1651248.1 protein kinase [Acidobacteriota bacterium]